MADKGAIQTGGDSLGLVDQCKDEGCRRVKWAGYGDLCPSCKAKREMFGPPDNSEVMTDRVPQEKP